VNAAAKHDLVMRILFVSLSVLWENERSYCQYWDNIRKTGLCSFLTPIMIDGDILFCLKVWLKVTDLSKDTNFIRNYHKFWEKTSIITWAYQQAEDKAHMYLSLPESGSKTSWGQIEKVLLKKSLCTKTMSSKPVGKLFTYLMIHNRWSSTSIVQVNLKLWTKVTDVC